MKFSSIKEYFYNMQSRCYALLLLPLLLLIALYTLQQFASLRFVLPDEQQAFVLRISLPAFALLSLTSVHLVMVFRLKKVRRLKGMGERLDEFAIVATLKMLTGVFVSILILVGLLLTADELFIGYFLVCLFFVLIQRPSPNKVSKHLQLKGDERELILKGELV